MAHKYRKEGPGGLIHVTLGVGILMGIGLFSHFPDSFGLPGERSEKPRMILTQGHADARCQANTVDTIIGTLGCGGARKAVHLERTTLVSAMKDKE